MIASVANGLKNIVVILFCLWFIAMCMGGLTGCASDSNRAERRFNYIDSFLEYSENCKARGGMVILEQRIPRPIRNGIPPNGTRYSCARR